MHDDVTVIGSADGNQPHLVEIVAALKEITERITSAGSVTEAVNGLLKVSADIVTAETQCGMALISQGEPATFTATGVPPDVLDEIRYGDGDGPCMEAVRTRGIVISQDLGAETRWPTWSQRARERGFWSVLAYPFDVDALMVGSFNLYATERDAFAHDIPLLAMLLADHASVLLRARMRQLVQEERLARVNDLPPGDTTVERAIGIVMAQRGCPPDQALRHLHDAATHLGVGLPAVAERLVQTVGDRAS